jgi:hypothetical protein
MKLQLQNTGSHDESYTEMCFGWVEDQLFIHMHFSVFWD